MAVNTKLRYEGPIIPIVSAFGVREIWELREQFGRDRRQAFRELPNPDLGMLEPYRPGVAVRD